MTDQQSAPNPYDVVPYDGTHVRTHPFRLETAGRLLGINTPPVVNCRVLELGAARGSNLMHMADSLPNSTFLGIDLSQRQIDEGREIIRAVGLGNIELRQADILEIDESWGQFDYIICHGVYSWVPAPVREKILDACKTNLAPNGIALVSYNVFPGWHMNRMIRDVVLYHASQFDDPKEQITGARKILRFLLKMHPEESIFGRVLRRTLGSDFNLLSPEQEFYLFHDLMEPVNEPCLFSEFMDAAVEHGLQYVSDSSTLYSSPFALPPEARKAIENAPLIRKEQYKDFLLNRMFRSTLLCHDDVKLERQIKPEKAKEFHCGLAVDFGQVAIDIRNDDTAEVPVAHGKMTVTDRLAKAALMYLKEIYPQFASFEQLLETAVTRVSQCGGNSPAHLDNAADRVASFLLIGHACAAIELCMHPPQWYLTISERPLAKDLTRYNATRGRMITNPLQVPVNLNAPNRYVLQHLDGQHSRDDLVAILSDAVRAGTFSVKGKPAGTRDVDAGIIEEFVDSALKGIARAGLLVG